MRGYARPMTRPLLLASALLAAASAAFAGTSAHVTIGTPEFKVFDLDRNDGLKPRVSEGGARFDAFDELRPVPISPDAQGAASITAFDGQNLAGQTFGPRSSFLAVGDSYLPSFTMTVSGNTRVTVLTPYTLGWSVSREPSFQGLLPGARASAEVMLLAVNGSSSFAALSSGDEPGYTGYNLLASRTAHSELAAPEDRMPKGNQERSGILRVSFDNPTPSPAVFALRAEMVVAGHTADVGMPPPPVPEPTTLALSLVGVAGLVGGRRLVRRG